MQSAIPWLLKFPWFPVIHLQHWLELNWHSSITILFHPIPSKGGPITGVSFNWLPICFMLEIKDWIECCYFSVQLVQFLLKQAGIDKRTGDLYGNRDLLNIARNMARGLKVCTKVLQINVTWTITSSDALIGCRELRMSTPSTSLFSLKRWKELWKGDCEMLTIHLLATISSRAG